MSTLVFSFFIGVYLILLNADTDTQSTPSLGLSCSKTVSATTNEILNHQTILYVFPQAEVQTLIQSNCGASAKQIFSDNKFELHEPKTPSHGEQQFPVEYAEGIFEEKWNNFIKSRQDYVTDSDNTLVLDPFFDHNFAMYAGDLTLNLNKLQDQSDSGLDYDVPYQILKWELDNDIDGASEFISLLVYLPKSQIIYELVTLYDEDTFDTYLENEVVINSEPRVSFAGFAKHGNYPWKQDYQMTPLRQGRAVSNIDLNVKWYQEMLEAEIVESGSKLVNGQLVEYTYITLPYSDNFCIGFFKREDMDDNLPSIKEFEEGLNQVHKNFVISPNCQYDRWFDNHYAASFFDTSMTDDNYCRLFNRVTSSSSERYILFFTSKEYSDTNTANIFDALGMDYLWYINLIEPNGNSIEVVGVCENDEILKTTNPFDGLFCNLCTDVSNPFDENWEYNGQYLLENDDDDDDNKKKDSTLFFSLNNSNSMNLTNVYYVSGFTVALTILAIGVIIYNHGKRYKVTENDIESDNYGTFYR